MFKSITFVESMTSKGFYFSIKTKFVHPRNYSTAAYGYPNSRYIDGSPSSWLCRAPGGTK